MPGHGAHITVLNICISGHTIICPSLHPTEMQEMGNSFTGMQCYMVINMHWSLNEGPKMAMHKRSANSVEELSFPLTYRHRGRDQSN
jgi:hypothetical protein